jgi:hypothetical protein
MTGRSLPEKKKVRSREMRSIRDLLDLRSKKTFKLGLLLVSTVLIITASAFVYSRMTYETALNVGSNGGTTGSPPTGAGETFPPSMIVVLAFSTLVIGISLFVFLREALKHRRHVTNGPEAPSSDSGSTPAGREDWEEFPARKE